jgi:serine/threonine-protein kinase
MVSPGNSCTICGASYDESALFCPKDGAPLGARAPKGPDAFIGLELPGQIRIERLIGIGSMGRVYLALQQGIGRHVAVKILHEDLSHDPTLVTRFHREAQIASRLSHPNLVQTLMAGQLPEAGAGPGAMYIVMEYLDGISLRSALAAAGGAIQLPRALGIVLQICDAVGEAHRAGVVHRDLKPENIMLQKRPHDADFVKVLDFGIARIPGGPMPTVTRAGAVFGTARYVSPEGAIGSPVGPEADVYAIATILYQALAGRTPFEGDTAVEILSHQINSLAPPLRSIERASHVPDPLARAIMRNLAKRADERSPDARALGTSLIEAARASGLTPEELVPRSPLFEGSLQRASFAAGERTKQQVFGAALAEQLATAKTGGSSSNPTPIVEHRSDTGSSRRSRGPLVLVLGCLVGGAALAALASYRSEETPTADTALGKTSDPRHANDAGADLDGRTP